MCSVQRVRNAFGSLFLGLLSSPQLAYNTAGLFLPLKVLVLNTSPPTDRSAPYIMLQWVGKVGTRRRGQEPDSRELVGGAS